DCSDGGGLSPDPKDCTKFYECSYNKPFHMSCPSTLHFSPSALISVQTSKPPVSYSCVPPCPSPEALYPHPNDCTKYFHCAKNIPYLKPCPAGQE
ncbi:Chitin binding domain, partial [Trinorchestia longiramus]